MVGVDEHEDEDEDEDEDDGDGMSKSTSTAAIKDMRSSSLFIVDVVDDEIDGCTQVQCL